jgi:hypothetical protein
MLGKGITSSPSLASLNNRKNISPPLSGKKINNNRQSSMKNLNLRGMNLIETGH